MKYIVEGENPERPVIEESLKNEAGLPMYCQENLITHLEENTFGNDFLEVAVESFYKNLYDTLNGQASMLISNENIAQIIRVIEAAHAQNPLPVKY